MATAKAAKSLKIGIICEGGVDCPDEKVLLRAIKLLCPRAIVDIVPAGNRRNLLSEAPRIAQNLLNDGCTAVFVVWDVFPGWEDQGGTTDCTVHRNTLLTNLGAAKVSKERIIPIAIQAELEAWLLADGDALSAAMSTSAHKVKVGHERSPDTISNPKKKLDRLFRTNKVGTYNVSIHAGKIASNWKTTKRLERSQSFLRLAVKVRALCGAS